MECTIVSGSRIFVTSGNNYKLELKPDNTLAEYTMYLKYDYKIDGTTILPKGTRIDGYWISESQPELSAQFQATQLYLYDQCYNLEADSDVYTDTVLFDNREVENSVYFYKLGTYKAVSNVVRVEAMIECKKKILYTLNPNTVYLEIPMKEIPLILKCNLTINTCNKKSHNECGCKC